MHGFLEDVISLIEMVFVPYSATSKRKSTCKMDKQYFELDCRVSCAIRDNAKQFLSLTFLTTVFKIFSA